MKLSTLGRSVFIGLTFSFLYLPIFILIIFSFNSRSFPSSWDNFTLIWYKLLFTNTEIWVSFFNSLIIAICSTTICISLTIFMIYFLYKGGKIGKFITIFYGNLIIPETVLAVGLISYFTTMKIPLGMITIIIAHSVIGLGFSIPLLYIRYKDLDKNIFEASLNLGASHLQTFIKIALPLIRPTLLTSGLIIFIISFDDFILAYFCSGNSIQTLPLFLISSIRYGISPIINALASILLVMTTIIVVVFFYLKKVTKIL